MPAGDRETSRAQDKTKAQMVSQRELKLRLKKTCSENNASSSAEVILAMAAIAIPDKPPKTLPALAKILESGGDEINKLDRFLYATSKAEWNGESFYETFQQGLVFKTSSKKAHEALAPLYPT